MALFGDRSTRVVENYIAALNARDLDALSEVIGANRQMVDSRGEWIEGYEVVIDATRRMIELEPDFKVVTDDIKTAGGDVMLSGHIEADDPGLASDSLWLARTDGDTLTYWQSYAKLPPPALARILAPNAYQSEVI